MKPYWFVRLGLYHQDRLTIANPSGLPTARRTDHYILGVKVAGKWRKA